MTDISNPIFNLKGLNKNDLNPAENKKPQLVHACDKWVYHTEKYKELCQKVDYVNCTVWNNQFGSRQFNNKQMINDLWDKNPQANNYQTILDGQCEVKYEAEKIRMMSDAKQANEIMNDFYSVPILDDNTAGCCYNKKLNNIRLVGSINF